MRVRIAANAPPIVIAGRIRVIQAAGAGNRQPSQLDGEDQDQDWAQREVGERQAEEADHAERVVVPAIAPLRGAYTGGNRQHNGDEQRSQG